MDGTAMANEQQLTELQSSADALQRDVDDLNLSAQEITTAMSAILCKVATLSGQESARLTHNLSQQRQQLGQIRELHRLKYAGVH